MAQTVDSLKREWLQPLATNVGKAHAQDNVEYLYMSLKTLYKRHFLPLEEHYSFGDFFSPPLQDNDVEAKPFVLLIGQYSVGKTSFINHLLGDKPEGYPGSNVGPEPTTDRFMAIMHGTEERVLPGNAVAVSPGKPFRGLQSFGNAFLQKFHCAEMNADILQSMTLIDTPGVLSGEKQRIGRNYDMSAVSKWFAERSDLILLLFDAHKLDISDELKTVIETLRGNDDKIRIVLNKADQVTPQQLMRVYGALMWSLGKVFKTPEVTRVYISSFWDKTYSDAGAPNKLLFDKEKQDLFRDLRDIPKNAAVRRVNEMVKRARTAKVHALVCACLKKMMPSMFGKEKKQKELLSALHIIFQAVAQEHNISPGDFPDVDDYRTKLQNWCGSGRTLANLPKLNRELIKKLDACLSNEIPNLLAPLAIGQQGTDEGARIETPAPAQSSAFSFGAPGSEQETAATMEEIMAALNTNDDADSRPGTAASAGGGGGGGGGGKSDAAAPHQDTAAASSAPNKQVPPPPPVKAVPPVPPPKQTMVRVLHAYAASSEGELTIDKGDEIRVTEEDTSGWWKGVLRGQEGWFPFNYVEKM